MGLFFDGKRHRLTGFGIFALFLAAALLLNASELANPPFYDEIIGLHNQAIYLAKHHFDTASLFTPAQQHISGSWVYSIALMPWIYGALYSVLPPLAVHVAGHLINLFSLCGALTLLVQLIRRRTDDATALFWGFAAFCDPIIAGRFAAQGQEAPLVFCIMLSLFFAFRKKPYLALAAAVLGCTVKFTGVILLLAYLVFYLGQTVFLSGRRRKTALLAALPLVCAALFFYFFYHFRYGNPVRNRPIFGEILRQITLFYPYYAVFLAGLAVTYLLRLKKIRLKALMDPALLLWIFIGGYFCAYFLARAEQLPRYTAIVVMPMVLLASRTIRFKTERVRLTVLILLIALNCCNQYGLLLVPHRPSEGFASDLERSREYLAGLHSDMDLLRTREKELAMRRIVCRWPYAQMLTMPELRYVKAPLPRVIVADIAPKYASAKPLRSWKQLDCETLYLYSPRNLPLDRRYREFCLPRTTSIFEYVEYPERMADGLILFSNFPERQRR